jgi:hypothetical protein
MDQGTIQTAQRAEEKGAEMGKTGQFGKSLVVSITIIPQAHRLRRAPPEDSLIALSFLGSITLSATPPLKCFETVNPQTHHV